MLVYREKELVNREKESFGERMRAPNRNEQKKTFFSMIIDGTCNMVFLCVAIDSAIQTKFYQLVCRSKAQCRERKIKDTE